MRSRGPKKNTNSALTMISIAALVVLGIVYFDKSHKEPQKKIIKVGYTHNLMEVTGEVTAVEPLLENITIKTGVPPVFRSFTVRPSMLSGIKLGDIVKIKTEYRDINAKTVEVIRPPKPQKPKADNKGAKKAVEKDAGKGIKIDPGKDKVKK